MPKGKYRTARNVGFSSERLAPCIYRILAARAYFHGSSPRMWGTHRLQQHADAVLRFIPTHVGNTLRCSGRSAPSPVHPHACGEHLVSNCSQVARCGSSPRMWGTQDASVFDGLFYRFIPTHVGNTVGDPPTWAWRPVHPHACGEHGVADMGTFIPGGSSPRMWGTHLPYRIVFKEEKTPRKIYRLILYSVVRSRGWNATNCSPSNNTGCRRLTPRVWNS